MVTASKKVSDPTLTELDTEKVVRGGDQNRALLQLNLRLAPTTYLHKDIFILSSQGDVSPLP